MSQVAEKKRTTIYISTDVLEFLKIRSAKGNGNVSQQLEQLARQLMPKTYTPKDIKAMNERHAAGYEEHPASEDDMAELYASQSLDNL